MAQMSELTGEVVEGRQRDCLEERAMGLGPMMGVRDVARKRRVQGLAPGPLGREVPCSRF